MVSIPSIAMAVALSAVLSAAPSSSSTSLRSSQHFLPAFAS